MDPWLPRALLENVRGSPDAATSLPGTLFWEPKASANALGKEVPYQGKRYRQALEKCQASRVTVRRHAKSLAVPISLIKRAEAAGNALATFDRAQELSQDPISQSVSGWIKSSHMYVVGLNHVICMWLDYIR